jgi:antitoxin component YwqK of YwqJK toxin-antitoxin module
MTKFIEYNSPDKAILNEVFNNIPSIDKWTANIVENYVYSYVRKYHPNGSIKCEYRTRFGKKDGEYKEWWFSNGNLKEECMYVNGKLNGEGKFWYKNGQLCEQNMYLNGNFNGECKEWFRNGQQYSQRSYINCKEHGEFKTWDKYGKLREEMTYVDGKLHTMNKY